MKLWLIFLLTWGICGALPLENATSDTIEAILASRHSPEFLAELQENLKEALDMARGHAQGFRQAEEFQGVGSNSNNGDVGVANQGNPGVEQIGQYLQSGLSGVFSSLSGLNILQNTASFFAPEMRPEAEGSINSLIGQFLPRPINWSRPFLSHSIANSLATAVEKNPILVNGTVNLTPVLVDAMSMVLSDRYSNRPGIIGPVLRILIASLNSTETNSVSVNGVQVPSHLAPAPPTTLIQMPPLSSSPMMIMMHNFAQMTDVGTDTSTTPPLTVSTQPIDDKVTAEITQFANVGTTTTETENGTDHQIVSSRDMPRQGIKSKLFAREPRSL